MMTNRAEVVPVERHEAGNSIDAAIRPLIEAALSRGETVEALQSILNMRRQLKEEWAREEFYRALSAMQASLPPIPKDRVVKNRDGTVRYTYASFDAILEVLKPSLSAYGLSIRYETRQPSPNEVSVTCVVTHCAGHSERVEFVAPVGKSGNMLPIQEYGAAITYAKRYTLCMALGLSVDEDTDALQADEKACIVDIARLNRIWRGYVEAFGGPAQAKEAIGKVVGNAPKENWTEEQIRALEEGLEAGHRGDGA